MTLTGTSFGDTVASAEPDAGRAYEIVRERLVMLDIRPANRSMTTIWPAARSGPHTGP